MTPIVFLLGNVLLIIIGGAIVWLVCFVISTLCRIQREQMAKRRCACVKKKAEDGE